MIICSNEIASGRRLRNSTCQLASRPWRSVMQAIGLEWWCFERSRVKRMDWSLNCRPRNSALTIQRMSQNKLWWVNLNGDNSHKKALHEQGFFGSQATKIYIMPPMSGGAGIAGLSSGISATIASVVIIKPAIDAAFCNAARATLVGSRIPISIISPYSPVAAL